MATKATITREQSMSALAIANHVRIANARTLKEIAAKPQLEGLSCLAAILADSDMSGPIGTVPILRLLRAPRRIGEKKALQLMYHAGILSGERPLRRLTRRQRDVLVSVLQDPRRLWPRSAVIRGL